ncbi:MAG: acyl-CoA dehydrogenase family protein [Bacillota bacterium]|nr:acyl-CoA dehydrogenase family protein [Bacillota bacterium]
MSDELIKGGAFLLGPVDENTVFTPEDFDDIHLMIKKTSYDFMKNKVEPKIDEIEVKAEGVTVGLMREAGELGLIGSDIPEEYGGEEADKITTMIITENASICGGSYATAFGAHTGIGTLPIVYFGNKEQKEKYLPGLATAEKIAAYALTEPEAGSDALNIKTKAVLSDDGKYYILNGAKQYITNAAWADVIVTYAKIDGERFTAFIVDADAEGVSIDPEEKKMGIKGSSTCSVIFDNAKVPVENMLWLEGKGHQVAFNILNIGRFKLGAGCVGGSKKVIEFASEYALQRIQFKQPIAQFNIIKNKIANMTILTYMMESLVYRVAGMIEEKLEEVKAGGAELSDIVQAIQEYAIECSISKVFCSEAMDYIADEGVQIFGGYGYGEEYPAERSYRDSRINRIFEGTNEVNRMLIPGTLLRKAMKQEVPFMEAVMGLGGAIKELKEAEAPADSPAREEFYLHKMKTLFLLAAGNAAQKFGQEITNEQEVLCRLADMAMEVFAAESGLLRAKKMLAQGENEESKMALSMTRCFINDMIPKMEAWAKEVIAGTLDGEAAAKAYSGIRLLTAFEPINTFAPKREIADMVYACKKYFLDRM